jgi:alpha-ribazole phosphatase/probable phosphoglycerate mutase
VAVVKPEREKNNRTRVYLARHGQVENFLSGVYNGQTDVVITAVGRGQMRTLLDRLRDRELAAVYCSDLSRNVEGATIIASGLGLPCAKLPDLRERHFGEWEGLTYEEIGRDYPDLFESWQADVTAIRPPGGGESSYDLSERVLRTYLPLVEKHRGENIFILGHGGVNRVVLAHALKLELRRIFRMDQAFGCLNLIDYYDDGFAHVRLVNG